MFILFGKVFCALSRPKSPIRILEENQVIQRSSKLCLHGLDFLPGTAFSAIFAVEYGLHPFTGLEFVILIIAGKFDKFNCL